MKTELVRFVCVCAIALSRGSLLSQDAAETPDASEQPATTEQTPDPPDASEQPATTEQTPDPPEDGDPEAAPAEPTAAIDPEEEKTPIRLSLEECIRMAITGNLGVRMARMDEWTSQRNIVIARSTFDPYFNVSATYSKNRDPSVSTIDVGGAAQGVVAVNPTEVTSYSTSLTGTSVLGSTYNLTLQQNEFNRPAANALFTTLNPVTRTQAFVDLRQPLLQGGWYAVSTADVRIAQNNLEWAKEALELVLVTTVFQVETAYWQVAFATQNLRSRERALALALENLENARKRREVGSFSDNDVTTVESQWVLRKVDYEEAALLVANSRDSLMDLINYSGDRSLREEWKSGKGSYDHLEVICTTEPAVEAPLDRDAALAQAFKLRPDYRQIEISLRNQQIRVEVARNGLMPQVDVVGRWTQLGLEEKFRDSYASVGGGRFYDWLVGVELSVPLSNRGPRSIYRNTRQERDKLQLQRIDLENQIVLEVDLAIRTIKNLHVRVRDLEEDVRLKQQLLRDEKSKLEVGRTIAYTVSTIENDLVTSETEALRAHADLQTARADLRRATGRTLIDHRIRVAEE